MLKMIRAGLLVGLSFGSARRCAGAAAHPPSPCMAIRRFRLASIISPMRTPRRPKGGTLRLCFLGTFDSLNPFNLKAGSTAQGLSNLVFESLMARSLDEPFSLYGLIAQDHRNRRRPLFRDLPSRSQGALFGRQPDHRRRCPVHVQSSEDQGPAAAALSLRPRPRRRRLPTRRPFASTSRAPTTASCRSSSP